jgi:GDPmannose 4,6-dehydratase
MNKINLIIGTGIIGAYLSHELLNNKEKVIVTSRFKKRNYKNFKYLKIQKKIKFLKLDIKNKNEIEKIISKYNPSKIYYFAGQSSLTKSQKFKKETYDSHFLGTKNFLDILKKRKSTCKFFKANSGYIFNPKNGKINLNCNFSNNKNFYIQAQQKTFKLINNYRKFKLNLFNLVFLQVESPLRPNDFFIKKVCLGAKYKANIICRKY